MTKKPKVSAWKIILALVLALLVLQSGATLVNYFNLARLAVAFPYPLDYGEGPLLDQTLRIASGENIYHNNFAVPPYTISNYPPLFLFIQVPFTSIFGPAFWYGRAISVLSAVLTALFIGLTLYTLTGDWIGAGVGGLLLLAFPYIQSWSMYNRIDTLALAWSWAGLLLVVRWGDRRWGIPVAAALLIASIYTRQTYALAAPAGAFIWLLANRRWRKAIELAVIVGGASLVVFLLINVLTRGGFYLNIVTANVNPFSWDTVRWNWEGFTQHCYYLMALAGIYLVFERFFGRTRTWPLALPYMVGGTLTAITIGKDGSNVNYLYELAAALSLATGAAIAWMKRYTWVRALVLFMLVFQVALLLAWTRKDVNNNIIGRVNDQAEIAKLAQIVRDSDGIVLADEYMGLVPLAGKRLYFQPFEFKMLAEGGLWDQQPFLEQIVSHTFSAVLWYDPSNWDSIKARWTSAEQDAINSSYNLDDVIATTRVMRPRK